MNLKSEIIVEEDIDNIQELFVPEDKEFSNKRASYTITKEKQKLIFKIQAKDETALKAVKSSINKNLTIYKKVKALTK